ncbi:uncharacterized protein LOC125437020 [Sphaerodactylus townsendi]|uniref:uncharacterized protein LOC125437020 n=1 Tax=Sphaerodactylus townsendi TaxID=933632 RepID=UPI0020268320|nr:uncharacterized protein LOC125437020 [Sphaerodactylus townsendi]
MMILLLLWSKLPTAIPVPMSSDEEITELKRPSPQSRIQDFPQLTQPVHASLYSMCPICLGTFDNMLYLSPCLHSFCFLCTQDLLETKTECPFCKQPFGSVFHPVKVKGNPKELPPLSPTRHSKGLSPAKKCSQKSHICLSPKKHTQKVVPVLPFKKHPKELGIPLHDRSHSEDPISFACKDESPPEKLNHLLSSTDQKKPSLSKREVSSGTCSHEPCSVKSSEDLGRFINQQNPQKCSHWSVIEKKPNSDETSSGLMQNEKAQNTTADLPKCGDCAPGSLHNRATSAKLSRPNILEATLMLFLSGILLFVEAHEQIGEYASNRRFSQWNGPCKTPEKTCGGGRGLSTVGNRSSDLQA